MSAQQEAVELAEARKDRYVLCASHGLQGPFSPEQADEQVTVLWAQGKQPTLLKAVEIYEAP